VAGAQEEVVMQTGLHAFNWGLQRLGIGLAILVGLVVVAFIVLVAVVVVGQAAVGFAQ
jgi:hypothetical protein